jgi:hypothetical protein
VGDARVIKRAVDDEGRDMSKDRHEHEQRQRLKSAAYEMGAVDVYSVFCKGNTCMVYKSKRSNVNKDGRGSCCTKLGFVVRTAVRAYKVSKMQGGCRVEIFC